MGLMTGTGPLGREPAGEFNFEPPEPGRSLYLEPTPKRIRIQLGGVTIADSRRAMMLHESGHQPVYYFPRDDISAAALTPSDRHTRCAKKGEASYFTVVAGGEVVQDGAWSYPEPIRGAPPELAGLVAFYFDRVGRWLEEGEEIGVHPRDPYHRIDVLASDRQVTISLGGVSLAETTRALALFETGLPTRWYLPAADVAAALSPSDTITRCPYKGEAHYRSVAVPAGEDGHDLVWYYPEPLAEVGRITDLVCFFNEKVDIELDGVAQPRPRSPWSARGRSEPDHGQPEPPADVDSVRDAQNADPAVTRGS